MNNIRLFYPGSLSPNFESKLNKSQAHYLVKVMRVKVDESFSLFNKNGEWSAEIIQIFKGIAEFRIVKKLLLFVSFLQNLLRLVIVHQIFFCNQNLPIMFSF